MFLKLFKEIYHNRFVNVLTLYSGEQRKCSLKVFSLTIQISLIVSIHIEVERKI